jgi:hypothetical protein
MTFSRDFLFNNNLFAKFILGLCLLWLNRNDSSLFLVLMRQLVVKPFKVENQLFSTANQHDQEISQ